MNELMSLEDVLSELRDADPASKQYEALAWLRDLYYLYAEGFLDLDGDRVYPGYRA